MEFFKAATQYGDWEGTAAADEQPSSIRDYLKEKGLIQSHEFLVAATLYVTEHGYNKPFIRAFIFENADNVGSVRDAINANEGPIPVRTVEVPLTTEEFLSLFKRFNVMLTWRGLSLAGREYDAKE